MLRSPRGSEDRYRDFAKLAIAIERHALVAGQPNPDRAGFAERVTV
jgi:hypothetical protein